jgi:cyanophycinase-like exopeptidase
MSEPTAGEPTPPELQPAPSPVPFTRVPGEGWLALLGGGEFTFGETFDADRAWLDKAAPGPVGFLPAASGSVDYAGHFATYLRESFEREVETLPVFRARDGRRGKNAERVAAMAAVYIGAGVQDHLLEAVSGTPVGDALLARLVGGGVITAIAAAAQCAGRLARTLTGGIVPGLGWLPDGVVDVNFDPDHDRRLRQLMKSPEVRWGVGIPAGAALLLGPGGAIEVVDSVFLLTSADGEYTVLEEEEPGELM